MVIARIVTAVVFVVTILIVILTSLVAIGKYALQCTPTGGHFCAELLEITLRLLLLPSSLHAKATVILSCRSVCHRSRSAGSSPTEHPHTKKPHHHLVAKLYEDPNEAAGVLGELGAGEETGSAENQSLQPTAMDCRILSCLSSCAEPPASHTRHPRTSAIFTCLVSYGS